MAIARRTQSTSSRSGWRSSLASGLIYGVATYAALPPAGIWPLAFVAAAALIWGGCMAGDRPIRAGLLAAIGTLPLWFVEESWLLNVTPIGYPLLALYLAFFAGLTVYAIAVVRGCGWKIPMSIAAPLIWIACEMLRAEFVLTGYAWYLVAHPLIEDSNLCLPARVLGTYFVGFLLVAGAGSLVDAAGWSGVPRRLGGLGAAAVAVIWLATGLAAANGLRHDASNITEFRVGVVQTNVPQGQKLSWSLERQVEDFRSFMGLTGALAASRPMPDLIVWPETMFPGWALNPEALAAAREFAQNNSAEPGSPMRLICTDFADALLEAQRRLEVPMLIGAEAREGVQAVREDNRPNLISAHKYNSVIAVSDGRSLEARYDKVALTPFGEVIPWLWRWRSVQDAMLNVGAAGMKFDLAFGEHAGPLTVPLRPVAGNVAVAEAPTERESIRVATPVCFEITRLETCRKLVYGRPIEATGHSTAPATHPDQTPERAALIVNVSNDGWFGSERWGIFSSDARRAQHLLAGRWRCVELGVPMVRAVNTGLSAFVDAGGRIQSPRIVSGGGPKGDRLAQTEAALIGEVRIGPGSTPFGRWGNIFGWAALAGGLGLFVAAFVRRKSRRRPRVAPQ